MNKSRRMVIAMLPAAFLAACTAEVTGGQGSGGGMGNPGLPHSGGRTFETLDEYLAFLKERGAADIPYYELQPDGRYLFVRGRGTMNNPQYFTRAELMRKFGFSR